MSNFKWSLKYWKGLVFVVLILTIVGVFYQQKNEPRSNRQVFNLTELLQREHTQGDYSILVDEQGNVLDKMARSVYLHDEFIASDNRRYEVVRIEGNKAICHLLGLEKISLIKVNSTVLKETALPVQAGNKAVGIYYSHSDESYVPSDGNESIPGNGGVYDVGTAFANSLEKEGYAVINDTTPHEPHDDGSYRRSRRTAISLLKKGVAAIFDVHRDGVPDPNFYRRNINGQTVATLRFVVGRQNQNMSANLDFAKRLKAAADAKYPGLVRGIFLGQGSYNQDLSPRAVLIEAGTHTNSKENAIKGINLLADVVPAVLGTPGAGGTVRTQSTAADWKGVFLVILAFIVGGAAYLVISAGSWENALSRVRQITSIEWVNLLGWQQQRRPFTKDDKQEIAKKELSDKEFKNNNERADWQKD
ncbi:MAG: stage sporulation protein [Clostridia bacterium]|nr:stage sporulation protein [Clostridia bacterium]